MKDKDKSLEMKEKPQAQQELTLADILFDLGKSTKKSNSEEMFGFIDNDDKKDNGKKASCDSPLIDDAYTMHCGWFAKLHLDKIDLALISNLWYKQLDGCYRFEVADLLKRVYNSPVQAYLNLDRIRNLLYKGIITEHEDERYRNQFLSFIPAQLDEKLYGMNVKLSKPMVNFITGKAKEFIIYQDAPFESDNDHLLSWMMLWKMAYKIYDEDQKDNLIQNRKPVSKLPMVAQAVNMLLEKEAHTRKTLRFRTFREKHSLTVDDTLLFIMLFKFDMEDNEDSLYQAFSGSLDDYYDMHKVSVDKIRSSNLMKQNILCFTSSRKDIDKSALNGLLTINDWVKQELLGTCKPCTPKRILSDSDMLQRAMSDEPLFDLVNPIYGFKDIIVSLEQVSAFQRVISLRKEDTQNTLSRWGMEGFTARKQHRGYSALFHGAPGTGKTLAAEVIAGEMGRKILKTDASHIICKWFGQSEINAKALFEKYFSLCGKMQNPPILLFNEADQLLNKRNPDGTSGTEKAWNAVQNIILEAMENPQGVIIATTNLVNCLDEAYSRRFDLILEFKPPVYQERMKIWQVRLPKKMPGIADLDLIGLAAYELTGGQISKVIRNAGLHLAGGSHKHKRITKEILEFFCESELANSFEQKRSNSKVIGFRKAE